MNVQRVFGCGIDWQTFKMKYEGLSDLDEKLRLERVAKRLQFTLHLRYRVAFYKSPIGWNQEGYTFVNEELPSTEIYLLCTCLDTLAGKRTYLKFEDWVESREDAGRWDKNSIINLYKQYSDEYGIGKNLKNLFTNLSPVIKTWLSNNIVISRSGQSQPATETDPDRLMIYLYTFFYELWRNTFTHTAVSPKADIAEDIFEPTKEDTWWSYPPTWSRFNLNKKQGWELSYKTGLDLATILRLIINVVVLQILEVDVTQEYISLNLRNFSRLNGLYAFTDEVGRNSETLRALSQLDERELGNYLVYRGIPLLRSAASNTMVARYNVEIPLEASLHKTTMRYVADVSQINNVISNFNMSNPVPESPKDNFSERLQNIKDFLGGLAKTPIYESILSGPPVGEMSSVWIVIQDPCYT